MLKKLKKGLKKAAKGVAKVGIPVGAAILAAKAMKENKTACDYIQTMDDLLQAIFESKQYVSVVSSVGGQDWNDWNITIGI